MSFSAFCILTNTLSYRFIDDSEGVASRFLANDNITFSVSGHKRKGQHDALTFSVKGAVARWVVLKSGAALRVIGKPDSDWRVSMATRQPIWQVQ